MKALEFCGFIRVRGVPRTRVSNRDSVGVIDKPPGRLLSDSGEEPAGIGFVATLLLNRRELTINPRTSLSSVRIPELQDSVEIQRSITHEEVVLCIQA